jgi:hypothetical protein
MRVYLFKTVPYREVQRCTGSGVLSRKCVECRGIPKVKTVNLVHPVPTESAVVNSTHYRLRNSSWDGDSPTIFAIEALI